MKRLLLAFGAGFTAVALVAFATDGAMAQGTIASGLYLGQSPPGSVPEVFAPGIISLDDRYEYSIAFSPDLTECSFGITNNLWSTFTLLFTTMASDSSWSEPVTAPYLGAGEDDGLSPAYASDGDTIFFASVRPAYPPANLWKSVRNGAGWDPPVQVPDPVSTTADEFAPCLTDSDVLYFVSYRGGAIADGDIYRAVPSGGVYTVVENVGEPVNSSHLDSTPFIAPDERYILFESNRPGGFGRHDLYVSFRSGGEWTEPENLGPEVNTSQIEDEPYVTPDGRYLFFNRRAQFITAQQTDLYWVDLESVFGPTSAEEIGLGSASPTPALHQNAPNPFHGATRIEYTLPTDGFVTIDILDVAGRVVERLVDRRQVAGAHTAILPPSRTRRMASGPYFYRLSVDGESVTTKRLTLVR